MLEVKPEDRALIMRGIERGTAVLILGAGASASSTTRSQAPVLQSNALAKLLAETAGYTYSGEELTQVLTATIGPRLSRLQLDRLLQEHYTQIRPSSELEELLAFTWYRLYTWNIDDSIDNIKKSVQQRRYFNGIADKVATHEGPSYLHTVYLHGQALKPEHGFVLTEEEYHRHLRNGTHAWYREAASDYLTQTPIFIGSRLKEPILRSELDRARPPSSVGQGVAFLITPDEMTPLQSADFSSRGVTVINATLAQFVSWLKTELAIKQWLPSDVAKSTQEFALVLSQRTPLTQSDIQIANTIRIICKGDGGAEVRPVGTDALDSQARYFLEGSPPTWEIVASEVPVMLHQTASLYDSLKASFKKRDRVFMIYGQSGSGKTTAALQTIMMFSRENPRVPIYELSSDTKSLRASLVLLTRLHPDEQVIVYLSNAFVYGDNLSEDVTSIPRGRITIVTSSRTNEWKNHLARRLQDVDVETFNFQRFSTQDYDSLAGKLIKYVPAPTFRKMTPAARRHQFETSRSQLLIALKEATHSAKFTSVITSEYLGLPDEDARYLLLIIGVATIARSGISPGAAKAAFESSSARRSFVEVLATLEGIVSQDSSGRLNARHELYVRHILDNVAPLDDTLKAMIAVLETYTRYSVPIVKMVGRQDTLLFKFLLNHNFIIEVCRRRGDVRKGANVYKSFEVDFQLDGHYWLQYGQYFSALGENSAALPLLEKSVQAYPDNPFASHALADVQLRVAIDRKVFDTETEQLIGGAVDILERLHVAGDQVSDQYPIVTLSEKHIGALIRYNQMEEAKNSARRYFNMMGKMTHVGATDAVEVARGKLLRFLSNGEWKGARNEFGAVEPSGHGQKHSRRRRRGRARREPD